MHNFCKGSRYLLVEDSVSVILISQWAFSIEKQTKERIPFGGGPGEPFDLLEYVFGHHKENFWQVAESFLKARAPFKLWLEKLQTLGHRVKASGEQKGFFQKKALLSTQKLK